MRQGKFELQVLVGGVPLPELTTADGKTVYVETKCGWQLRCHSPARAKGGPAILKVQLSSVLLADGHRGARFVLAERCTALAARWKGKENAAS